MVTLILSLFFTVSFTDMSQKELTIDQVLSLHKQVASKSEILAGVDISPVTKQDTEGFIFKISHRVTSPRQFSFLRLVVEQFYLQLDSLDHIEVAYITVGNQDIVQKLTDKMGTYKAATGVSSNPGNPPSVYAWAYNGMCVDLKLNAYRFQFEEKELKDDATIVFNNCDMYTYLPLPRK